MEWQQYITSQKQHKKTTLSDPGIELGTFGTAV